jgi:hypothetical protein
MITKYIEYIKESSTFNKLNVEQEFIKKLYKKFDIIVNDTFNYTEINYDDLNIKDIKLKLDNRTENILLFIITEKNYYLIYNQKTDNEYYIYEYFLNTKRITHLAIKKFNLNEFLLEIDYLNEDYKFYYIYNFTNLSYKKVNLKRINVQNIKDLYKEKVEPFYKNYYKKLKNECEDLLKNSNNEKYKNEILEDINNLDFYIKNIQGHSYITKFSDYIANRLEIDLAEKKFNYDELYDFSKKIELDQFKINIRHLNIIKYKKWDKEIEKNPNRYKEIRRMIYDEKLISKYKYLEDSSNFDLI